LSVDRVTILNCGLAILSRIIHATKRQESQGVEPVQYDQFVEGWLLTAIRCGPRRCILSALPATNLVLSNRLAATASGSEAFSSETSYARKASEFRLVARNRFSLNKFSQFKLVS
jgi:hypothetical protein